MTQQHDVTLTGFYSVFSRGQIGKGFGAGWRYVFAIPSRKKTRVFDWASGDSTMMPLRGNARQLGWIESNPVPMPAPRLKVLRRCLKRLRRTKTAKAALAFAKADKLR